LLFIFSTIFSYHAVFQQTSFFYILRVRISIYKEIVIQMKIASSSFHSCLKQLSYIILYRSLISYIKLQRNIKFSENIIVNLLIFSLEENDLYQTESLLICWQKNIRKKFLFLFWSFNFIFLLNHLILLFFFFWISQIYLQSSSSCFHSYSRCYLKMIRFQIHQICDNNLWINFLISWSDNLFLFSYSVWWHFRISHIIIKMWRNCLKRKSQHQVSELYIIYSDYEIDC